MEQVTKDIENKIQTITQSRAQEEKWLKYQRNRVCVFGDASTSKMEGCEIQKHFLYIILAYITCPTDFYMITSYQDPVNKKAFS